MSSCFFIGHRDSPEELYPQLLKTLTMLVTEKGVTDFYVGYYGAFDRLAVRAIKELKSMHRICLIRVLPYHPAERPIVATEEFDDSFYPPGMDKVPRRYAIVKANQYMADHVDHLVAYAWHPASNARNLLSYAQKRASKTNLHVWVLQDTHYG